MLVANHALDLSILKEVAEGAGRSEIAKRPCAFCPQGSTGGCSQFVALAVPEWSEQRGFATLSIKPGSPWQNADRESLNSRFRDEFLNRELCGGPDEPV